MKKYEFNYKEIARRLNDAFIGSGFSVKGVAAELKVAPQTVSAWLRGDTVPSTVDFANLCILFKSDAKYILGLPHSKMHE